MTLIDTEEEMAAFIPEEAAHVHFAGVSPDANWWQEYGSDLRSLKVSGGAKADLDCCPHLQELDAEGLKVDFAWVQDSQLSSLRLLNCRISGGSWDFLSDHPLQTLLLRDCDFRASRIHFQSGNQLASIELYNQASSLRSHCLQAITLESQMKLQTLNIGICLRLKVHLKGTFPTLKEARLSQEGFGHLRLHTNQCQQHAEPYIL